ncbi:MAG: ParB/RepB/Spo0J family partition protein [Verrucomicrobia bacterium]|nr:ParB/RepB/Spo0J family partition protein [Verrucomicrobiota bacterium]
MAKQALGKGLGALIKAPKKTQASQAAEIDKTVGLGADEAGSGERVNRVSLDRLVASPFQPRKHFNDDRLDELMESIREQGVIQPLIVREVDGKLELIAGERRWRACQKIGEEEVPVIIREVTDAEALEMALIENLQREDLDPIEEAEAYARLSREFGLKQEEIAKRVGKSRATVANAIRLLDLEPSVSNLVSQGLLSTGHAKAILGVKNGEEQKLLADIILKKQLTVRKAEKLVSEHLVDGGKTPRKATSASGASSLTPYMQQLQERLQSHLGTRVRLHHGEKKGKIEIEYFGNDDLDRVLGVVGLPDE